MLTDKEVKFLEAFGMGVVAASQKSNGSIGYFVTPFDPKTKQPWESPKEFSEKWLRDLIEVFKNKPKHIQTPEQAKAIEEMA